MVPQILINYVNLTTEGGKGGVEGWSLWWGGVVAQFHRTIVSPKRIPLGFREEKKVRTHNVIQ